MSRSLALIPTLITMLLPAGRAFAVEPAPNGVTLPADYREWRLIGVSQRSENETLRAILGNDLAVRAAREGQTNPWPNGAILAKIVWKQKTHPLFATARVPDQLLHVEVMEKNASRYATTGGWGFGRWLGPDQKPFGQDAAFAQECFACHAAAKSADWVFTVPVKLP